MSVKKLIESERSTKEIVDRLSESSAVKVGDRVQIINMEDNHGVPSGTEGTVNHVDDIGQIHVDWDNGRTLAIVPEVDDFRVISEMTENRQFKDDDVEKGQVGFRCFEGSYQFYSEIIDGDLESAKKLAKKKLQDQYNYRSTDKTLWASFVEDGVRLSNDHRITLK